MLLDWYSLYAPFIIPLNLFLLLWSEVIGNVEHLPDLLRALAHDQVSHHLAGCVHQPPDVQVVRCFHYIKEHHRLHLCGESLSNQPWFFLQGVERASGKSRDYDWRKEKRLHQIIFGSTQKTHIWQQASLLLHQNLVDRDRPEEGFEDFVSQNIYIRPLGYITIDILNIPCVAASTR